MEKEILQALEKNQFCKTTTHGDAVILSSEIKKLYHLFTEMIEKGVYRVSNQTQMIIRCNAKISVNLYTIIADIVLWYSARARNGAKKHWNLQMDQIRKSKILYGILWKRKSWNRVFTLFSEKQYRNTTATAFLFL